MANIYDLVDTWNDGLTTFTAIKMDVTDTASASGSLLMDLQVGGTSKLSVRKDGRITIPSSDSAGIVTGGAQAAKLFMVDGFNPRSGFLFAGYNQTAASFNMYMESSGEWTFRAKSNAGFSWTDNSGDASSGIRDLILTRKGAANLRLGAADNATSIVAQTLSVQSVASGGLTPNIAGGDFTIQGSAGTGSGAGGSIIFQVAPADTTPGNETVQNTLVDALTINSSKQLTTELYNTTTPALSPAGSLNTGLVFTASNGLNIQIHRNGTSLMHFDQNGVNIASAAALSWSSIGAGANGALTTALYQDAANTLALRNGTNAQTFRVYRTYTGTADEWGAMDWNQTAETLEIGSFASGTGNSRNVLFVRGGANILQLNAASVLAYQPPCPSSDGGTSIGLTALRWNGLNLYPDTVANLPGSPAIGSIDVVNDGDSGLTHGQTVVNSGAGATPYLVWYNGTNWTVIGA